MESNGGKMEKMEDTVDVYPDDVMLTKEYAESQRIEKEANDPLDTRLDRPLTDEEIEEIGKKGKKSDKGLTIRPMITIRELGRKNKKPVIVPFIGIKGTF